MVINPIVGVYIPIIRIPIKGGMTIPNIATFDHGTYVYLYLFISQSLSSQLSTIGFRGFQERNRALDEEMRKRQEKLADARCGMLLVTAAWDLLLGYFVAGKNGPLIKIEKTKNI